MSREPIGLGKGIGAILGGLPNADQLRKPVGYINKGIVTTKPSGDGSDILRIPVDMIEANPYQPRLSFDQEALEELASSIRTLGLIQPITVRRIDDDRYQIISGERRYKACRMAGMTMVPAYVRDANDQGMLEMAIVENIQRADLDPVETAMSYQRLMDECSLTQDQMAERVGKKRASVANYLRLLRLPVKVQHDLKVGLLSVGHAKAILAVEDLKTQEDLCDIAISEGLSVRQLESLVSKVKLTGKVETPSARKAAATHPELPEDYSRMLGYIGRYFSKDISVKRNAAGKGTMTIRFDSDDEVRAFLKAFEKISE